MGLQLWKCLNRFHYCFYTVNIGDGEEGGGGSQGRFTAGSIKADHRHSVYYRGQRESEYSIVGVQAVCALPTILLSRSSPGVATLYA